jgi:small subunit ribosomal protein S21
MGARIAVVDGEPIGAALRRFKRQVEQAGLPWELRRRAYFVRDTEVRRAKEFQKRFKTRKAVLLAKLAARPTTEAAVEARAEFWRRSGKP